MAKRRKSPVKKARSNKAAPSRVSKVKFAPRITKAIPAKPKKKLAKAQKDPNWKKESKWGKVKKYVAKPSQVKWTLSRRKRLQEHHIHEGRKLRNRLYNKLDEFKKDRPRRFVKNVGYAYRLIVLADAEYGMSNPAIADESAFNLQYWTTPVMRTKEESKAELIDLLRRAEEQVSDFASFEVLKVIKLEFKANKDGSYAITEKASKVPSFKLWRPE